MSIRWLNLFLRFSSYVFVLKQKIVESSSWIKVLPYAVLLFLVEIIFAIVSLPMYLLVAPTKLQERGKFFPSSDKDFSQLKTYTIRRKISLTTVLGAGGIFLIKVIFISAVSLYLLGAQRLLASTLDWTFDTASQYTYDSAKIEVIGGVAQLKDIGSTTSGSTTNAGVTTTVTGWTYADWLDPGSVTVGGTRQTSGGNPGPYLDVNIAITGSATVKRTGAGYWIQSFTTTVDSPDTATLNLDWKTITFTSPTPPDTYRLYVFIDTDSADPVSTSTAVWNSGEISGITNWASIATVDVTSKIPTAGTYYLKIVAYATSPLATGSYSFISGFDNIIVNWSKVTHSYDTTKPTIAPTSSLTMNKTVSWNSFTETATKNGGEIYYQLSSDDGANWQYWNGSAWAVAGASNYNIATDVNTNISSFTTSSNKIKWQAFLSSNGSQQVILDNINIGYTENLPPTVQSLSPVQNSSYGYAYINYNLADQDSDPSSLVTYEYSLTGAFAGEQVTMTASSTDPNHSGVSALVTSPISVAHTFVWDAKSQLGSIYSTTTYVRMRANDGIANGAFATSSVFILDYVNPTVSNVSALETANTTDVVITFDLFDNTTDNLFVDLQVSADGGNTWTVPVTSSTGAVGSGVTSGSGKSIVWHAGNDYNGHQQDNMQVRVRARDKWQNQGEYASSTNFSLDTLAPASANVVDLKAQPNAGDTTVLIGGSFTEVNPSTNTFFASVSSSGYLATTTGDINTATPSDQITAVGVTLRGNDYISKVKIVHTDDYGQSGVNENISPSSSLKYVKPYTPAVPTLSNPITNRLDILINPNINEADGLEYAVYETTTNKYLQSDGTLGVLPVWQQLGLSAGQWGNGLGTIGAVRVTGLSSPVSQYVFQVKSRNPSDVAHAASSESTFSATAQISNTAPAISLDSYAQTTDGTNYVTIAYIGTDGQGDISSVPTYQYSTNNSNWFTMTQKSGVGSSGTSSLVFLPSGSNYNFVWDSGVDLANIETSTVRVRLKPNDSIVDGSLSTSNAFEIDNKAPIVSSVSATQSVGTRTVTISYNLTDSNSSLVELEISADGGSSWNVATTTASGAIGSGISAGTGKTITWNAATDFNGQYNTNMMIRLRARDSFGNQGSYAQSSNFTVDTHAPTISNVSAVQDTGLGTFTFHYDVNEDAGNNNIILAISSNSGSSWTVATSTAAGDIGSVTSGSGKTITWDGATNFGNQEKTSMQIRITAADQFNNNSNLASSDFSLDTQAPRVTSVNASEPTGGTNVIVNYTLADQNNSLIQMDISSDGGSSWNVVSSSVSGDIGSGIGAGSKTITWDAKTDFPNQQISNMQVRVRGRDSFNNQSGNTVSANYSLDTLNPASLITADLQAQPLAGETAVLVGGSFTEVNPNTNIFYVAIDGGVYGNGATGTANTATPADLSTPVGVTLKGNNYISKVKIVHTDDHGQSVDNENISPSSGLKYVKPYTPAVPTVDNPTVGTVDVTINKNINEVNGLEYAIYEVSQNKYVQANGTLGVSPVWQPLGVLLGQWGEFLLVSGKVRVTGLTTHSYLYQFQVKSRNSSDSLHAASSDSALSSGASSANQSPVLTINSVTQTTNGTKYVNVNYTGSDLESETSTLVSYEYSVDNSTWYTMTEKSGVGSEGVSGLNFSNSGSAHLFAWDVGTDLVDTEDNTVYVRLRANDGTSDGGIVASSAITIDTKNPIISSLTASQTIGLHNVSIGYNLMDFSNANIVLNISSDGGSTWNVATATVSGAVGANITPGSGKTITWNALADFADQENSNMRARLQATDSFGNQSTLVSSANFIADTKVPAISNVSAVQNIGNNYVSITYDLSDVSTSSIALEVSSDGGSTWNVTSTNVSGAVGANITPGSGKTITWNAGSDFPGQQIANMKVRLRATDIYNNIGVNAVSSEFALDTKTPLITNVSAAQILNSDNFNFAYDLFDSGNVIVSLDISSDGGGTWNVATSSVTGAVGTGVSPGFGKTISWNGGVDFANNQNGNMKIRIRATDNFNNTSINFESTVFTLDTLAPAVAIVSDLQSQPNAGDTTVLIGGSFTEFNPISNIFTLAINGGAYVASTTGDSNTASPADQFTNVGASLTGSDYISKVKITETDNFGHNTANENNSPNISYKFVKPYTPDSPTVNNPQNSSVDIIVNPHVGESNTVQYAILEVSTNKYVQTNGTLDTSAVWQTLGTSTGKWGNGSGVSGKITASGLSSPVANYSFKIKARNPADAAHASSSESEFSSAVAIANTAPTISIISVLQPTSTNYVSINYTGLDAQNDTNYLIAYEYSTDNAVWHTMTQKSGVGSSGTSSLVFGASGSNYMFIWDVATDLPNIEDATVYVRLQSSDSLANSNLAVSSAFAVDTLGPVVSNLDTAQISNSGNVTITYDLSDNSGSNNTVELLISSNGGTSWSVATTSVSGDVNTGVTAGMSRTITWNALADFANQENNTMRIKLRAIDRYDNIGSYVESINFSVDTKAPSVSSVSASQTAGTTNVVVAYTLADFTGGGNFVDLEISDDGGSTWTVPTTTVSGNIGAGQSVGSKTITWNAGTDFSGQAKSNMKLRVRARDYYANQGVYSSSANFSLDTAGPSVSAVVVAQSSSSTLVTINYNLSDTAANNLNTNLEISDDGGSTWTVPTTTVSGNIGAGQSVGSKTITWNAGTDFANQEISNVRVRIRATDSFGNIGSYFSSTDVSIDTKAPSGLASLSKFSSTANSVTLTWSSGVNDTHFNHYEIWHGSNSADVDSRLGSAVKWDVIDDSSLSNILTTATIVTGVTTSINYYAKIWAVDDYGYEATLPAVQIFEAPSILPSPITISAAVSVGGGFVAPAIRQLNKPVLNSLISPTKQSSIIVSGLADPRAKIDLYDNGILVSRLLGTSDNNGFFSQTFNFSDGNHSLTVRASDFDNNMSAFSDPINLLVVTTIPATPIIISPINNTNITESTPIITGVAQPLTTLEIILDNKNTFISQIADDGSWQFVVPSTLSLSNGRHSFGLRILDAAGNRSDQVLLVVNKISVPKISVPPVTIPVISGIIPSEAVSPIPPASLIRLNTQAIEVPGIQIPKVNNINASVPTTGNDVFTFSGNALPNQDVVVYIHSDQAVIYRAHADSQGVWRVEHSQNDIELAPGDHTVYAVGIDAQAKIKSRPSAVNIFTVKKNFWVMIFKYLNLQTTIVSLTVLSLTMLWLYKINKKEIA
jgi:hypothetical protein